MNFKVSVIIPVYNVEPYLSACLDSVCHQTLRDIEIICINDGSTDRSLDILQSYAERDSRIQVYSQENRGPGEARNAGIYRAHGEYIQFIDSDDMLEPDALLYAYEKAKAKKLDVFAFDAHAVFDSAEMETEKGAYRTYYPRPDRYRDITPGEVFFTRQILDGKFIMQACCQLIMRKFLLKSGVRFIPGILQEDNAFTVEMLLHAQRVSHENRPFYIRRVRPGSIMTRKPAFANAYGYFRCAEALIPYIDETSYQQETRKALRAFIQSLVHNMKRIYDSISAEERKKFMDLTVAEDRAMGRLLLCSESVDFSKKE